MKIKKNVASNEETLKSCMHLCFKHDCGVLVGTNGIFGILVVHDVSKS